MISTPSLRPPLALETGSIVTLRMRGHSRTNGQDYFSPAIVLRQYDNPTGDIEVLIWDSTAGTHFNCAYPVRDLSSRGAGSMRELFESQSNVGEVLFSPVKFKQMADDMVEIQAQALQIIAELQAQNMTLKRDLTAVMLDVEMLKACIEAPPPQAVTSTKLPVVPPAAHMSATASESTAAAVRPTSSKK